MSIASISPSTYERGIGRAVFSLVGTNLQKLDAVKFVKGSSEVLGAELTRQADRATVFLEIPATMPDGNWDVVLVGSDGSSASLPGGLAVS
jgi:hypothetical protein